MPPRQTAQEGGIPVPLPQASRLLTHFATFLTLALHSLLYHRSLYPAGTFLTARAYGLPVQQSRHPGVCRWITDAVEAVVTQLRIAAVERIVFAVHEKGVKQDEPPERPVATTAFAVADDPAAAAERRKREGGKAKQRTFNVIERWVFDVSNFPAWSNKTDITDEDNGRGHHDFDDEDVGDERAFGEGVGMRGGIDEDREVEFDLQDGNVVWTNVIETLRGALGRLAQAAEKMPRLPEGCPFTIAIELRGEASPPIGTQSWIPAQPPIQPIPYKGKGKEPMRRDPPADTTTMPIRAVQAGPLFFECWVEQSRDPSEDRGEETLQISRGSRDTRAGP